eukprot:6187186-Pleurochrysis_carterae.AAC.1
MEFSIDCDNGIAFGLRITIRDIWIPSIHLRRNKRILSDVSAANILARAHLAVDSPAHLVRGPCLA